MSGERGKSLDRALVGADSSRIDLPPDQALHLTPPSFRAMWPQPRRIFKRAGDLARIGVSALSPERSRVPRREVWVRAVPVRGPCEGLKRLWDSEKIRQRLARR